MANLSNINNKFLVTTGGNVLIGQTAVVGTSMLQVEGSTNAIIRMNSTGGTGGRMDFTHSGSNYGNIGSARNMLGVGNASDMMVNGDSILYLGVGAQHMTILSSGNVGIGLTGPTAKLHVFEPTANTGVTLKVQSYSWDATLSLINDQGTWEIVNDQTGLGTNGTLAFYNGGYRMALTPAGNLGIGTTAPSTKLHINQSSNDRAGGFYTQLNGYSYGLSMFVNSGGYGVIGSNGSYTTDILTMDLNNGKVGIGNTSPQTTLHVGTTTTVTNQFTNQVNASNFLVNGNANGGASFFQCKTAAVNINMMGNNDFACNQFTFYHKPLSTSQNVVGTITTFSSSTQYNTTSDYRLKENVIPLSDSITRLKHLKPSRFNFIEDPERTMDGFLAHEVQDIVPEAVNGEKDAVDENGNEVHQGIDQTKLVPLLVAAIQELEARVKELENK